MLYSMYVCVWGGELVFLVLTFSHPLGMMCGLGSPDGNRWTQKLSYTAVVSIGAEHAVPLVLYWSLNT